MRKIILVFAFIALSCSDKKETVKIVETYCGQCQFGLTSQKGCDLVVKITDHGDAHNNADGFCEVIRKAKVTGEIKNNRFIAKKFEIVK